MDGAMVHLQASQVVGDVCAVLACTAGSDTGQSWWKPTLEACPSRAGLLVTTGCPCVVEAARLVGPAMHGVIAGFTASRSNRALLAVFVLCSLYALYLLGDSLTPKNIAYDPTRKFLRDPTPAGNTPMVDEAALLAGPGHHASHTSALMDYLYGGLTPEHPTVVAGLFIPDMPQDWTPYASTLQLLLNFRPWMEVVVFSTDVQVKSAVVKLGAHCLDEYPLGHGLYPLVGGLLSALKAHEADALFYGLIDPTALLHSDIVSSLHSIANEQTAGTLPPQAFVVGRTVVPEEHINQAAVAQAVRGDPRLLHVAIHDLAMHGQLRPAEEMDYFFVSRSAWDWDQAPPIMYGIPGAVHFLLDAAIASQFAAVDVTGTVVCMLQQPRRAVGSNEEAALNAKVWGDHPPHYVSTTQAPWVTHVTEATGSSAATDDEAPRDIQVLKRIAAPAVVTTVTAPAPSPAPAPAPAPASAPAPAPAPASAPAPAPAPVKATAVLTKEQSHHHHSHGGVDLTHAPTKKVETVVTMFTTPFGAPVGSQKYYIQQNAVRALAILPEVDVVVFSHEQAVRDMMAPLPGVEVVDKYETNKFGTPFLHSMFQHVEHHAGSHMFGYMNADILFCSELVDTLQVVIDAVSKGKLKKHVLVVGRRTNVQLPKKLHDQHAAMITSLEDIDHKVKTMAKTGQLFQTDAEDFFIITPGTFNWAKMPQFVIGRPGYDNWLVDYGYHHSSRIDMVDVTKTVHAVHQTGVDGNKAGHKARPDKKWNLERGSGGFDHGRTVNCNWETRLKKGRVVLKQRKK